MSSLNTLSGPQQKQQPFIIRVMKGKKENTVPLWMMRQAGRYLPEYRELRKQYSFWDLLLSPEKASQITLQPLERFALDAAILFSDILVIPYALGQKVHFHQGVHLGPLPKLEEFNVDHFLEKLSPIFQTVKITKKKLDSSKALIGFAGCPWTVMCYMLGGTSKDGFFTSLKKTLEEPKEAEKILFLLTEATIVYLSEQIKSGVDAIQIFETWAPLVSSPQLERFIIKPVEAIIRALKKNHPDIPIIFYSRGDNAFIHQKIMTANIDVLSVDLGYRSAGIINCAIQGNLDPQILLMGGDPLRESVSSIKKMFKNQPFIFNLARGILPNTPVKNVEMLIELVKNDN